MRPQLKPILLNPYLHTYLTIDQNLLKKTQHSLSNKDIIHTQHTLLQQPLHN